MCGVSTSLILLIFSAETLFSFQIILPVIHRSTHIEARRRSRPEIPQPSQGSEDCWEKWEFGDESFIDAELARSAEGRTRPLKGNEPLKGNVTCYPEAIELLRPFALPDRVARMEEVLALRTGRARFVIEDPINPSNAWACLRTLDSFGVQYVDVITDPANYLERDANTRYKRMNTAMGTQKWLDIAQHDSAKTCIEGMKDRGWTIVATDLSPSSIPLAEVPWADIGPYAVVMGNEERGISQGMRDLADITVHVPMNGFAQSFSLSVGCAVVASHLSCAKALCPDTLPSSERDRILFDWLLESVKGGRGILRRNQFDIPLHPPPRKSVLNFSTK